VELPQGEPENDDVLFSLSGSEVAFNWEEMEGREVNTPIRFLVKWDQEDIRNEYEELQENRKNERFPWRMPSIWKQ
jgi:hypothetical protein